ncbi:MAG TPA: ImmA/IrrE family metallo-endopeptidase [Bdellovibrionota bacterium]|nr:ImmA/IrrE family metallo-endopeptidase [Bdellovibrionota bacterium]
MSSTPGLSTSVQELLEDLDLFRLPVIPKEVCRRLGIEYREYRYEGIEGSLMVIGSHQLIAVNAKTREASRRAFTCAHELGHYYFDLDEGESSFTCSENDVIYPSQDPRELRANEFAAELLMPTALVMPMIKSAKPSWEVISKLAEVTGSSLQAAAQRYVALTKHPCWLAFMDGGQIRRYQKQDRAKQHLSTKAWIDLRDCAERKWEKVPAALWMGKGRYTRGKTLYQAIMPENQYGDTLALIWDRHREFSFIRRKAVWKWLLAAGLAICLFAWAIKAIENRQSVLKRKTGAVHHVQGSK